MKQKEPEGVLKRFKHLIDHLMGKNTLANQIVNSIHHFDF
jgi:hypothetical protein